jgi:acyl carrier protein
VDIEKAVRCAMIEVAQIGDCQLIEPIVADTLLLQSGLDSLAYAMLVAQLEEDLGFDPFTELAIKIYPSTFSEFVAIYQQGYTQKSV